MAGFFRDYLESRAQRTSPAYAAQKRVEEERAYAQAQAEAMARANVYGDQGQEADMGTEVPNLQTKFGQMDMNVGGTEVPRMEGFTPEQKASGIYDQTQDTQTRVLGLQDRMMKSGIPALQKQALELQVGFQKNILSPKQARALNDFEQSQATPQAWAKYKKDQASFGPNTDKRTANRKDFDYWNNMPEGASKEAYGKLVFGQAKPTAAQKVFEKSEAERIIEMPNTIDSMDSMLVGIDEQDSRLDTIEANINDDTSWNTTTGFVGAKIATVEGTPAYEQKKRIDQFGSKVYFQAIADLKSKGVSLGPQTDRDMEALRTAEANLDVAQSAREQKKQIGIIRKKQNALRKRLTKRRNETAKNWNKQRKNLPSTDRTAVPLQAPSQGTNTPMTMEEWRASKK